MNPKTYILTKISDLLSVPLERREDCVKDLLLGLTLHELAYGDEASEIEITEINWTDDGDRSVSVGDVGGSDVLRLKVTKEAA